MFDSLRAHGLYVACQAPLSMELSRQEYWNGLLFPSLVPGASVRNPARGKGHEEGSQTKRNGVIRLQGFPLDFPEHLPPKTRVCLLYCVMLSTYSSDINRGLSPHHLFPEKIRAFR